MTYARSRLWLGISGVGFIVVLSSFSLWFGLPHRLLGGLSDLAAISLTLLCFIAISIPSDLLGGYLLPRRHSRSQMPPLLFLGTWLRGVVSQAALLGLCALALLQAGKWGGRIGEIACFAVIMLLLLATQSLVARLVGGLSKAQKRTLAGGKASPENITVFNASDPGFVGGWVGLPGISHLVVPELWLNELAPDVLAAELIRRRGAIETGARTRGLMIALVWNIIGFAVACNMPGSSTGNVSGLVEASLWFTLWSFLGLLTLPSLNRPAVQELDAYALAHGVPADLLATTIARLDILQDDEPERRKWVERVFHPIPAVQNRMAELNSSSPRVGGWQCARTALYLSWACFGFLARAVHCNAGRPQLWVLFPGD